MAVSPLERQELFHLTFLRRISIRLAGRPYALKGGICLRFFHRSARLSQDMDLDVSPQVRAETLRNAVDSILESRSFLAALMPHGVTRIQMSKPKQMETTQRWKVALYLGGQVSLPTRIEFSRRQRRIPFARGIPDPEILNRYRTAPFAAQFYDSVQMAAQKIRALACPTRTAARDLFDLHHLLSVGRVPVKKVVQFLEPQEIQRAVEKARGFSVSEFKEQVLPYLTESLVAYYRDPSAFEKLKAEVEIGLTQGAP